MSTKLTIRERSALERLMAIAQRDTGQSARVANFLLAWWNAAECGGFDLTDAWSLDEAIWLDAARSTFGLATRLSEYPDTLGYARDLAGSSNNGDQSLTNERARGRRDRERTSHRASRTDCPFASAVLFVSPGGDAAERFVEFFAASIRNRHTRRAYYHVACSFASWMASVGVKDLQLVMLLHVATYIEGLTESHSRPTAKQHLAALRRLFDWLVVARVRDINPAQVVRGPEVQR